MFGERVFILKALVKLKMYLSKMLKKQFSNIISNWFELNSICLNKLIRSTREAHICFNNLKLNY